MKLIRYYAVIISLIALDVIVAGFIYWKIAQGMTMPINILAIIFCGFLGWGTGKVIDILEETI